MPYGRSRDLIERQYALAKKVYVGLGVNTDEAIAEALKVPLSLHCWQGDDITGFEVRTEPTDSGGLVATGNFPGRARNGEELRQDLGRVLDLAPGAHRVNLHAMYAETDGRAVDRDALRPEHFAAWVAWAKKRQIGLDFNSTFFAHPLAAEGLTLSHPNPAVRLFWIRHGIACRRIAEHIGRTLRRPCVMNHWLPDGKKDSPADRWQPRARLRQALDAILDARPPVARRWCLDAVEGKLFGIGSEDFVVGSHEFYNCYALTRGIILCLDMGHFHPTETVHDKLSALMQFHKRLLLHISRPIRWDSDHVVILNDDLRLLFQEIVRGGVLKRVALALDFFDASINRIAAYIIGARAARQALLLALLEPRDRLKALEQTGRNAEKLALIEELKTAPFGPVWDMLCLRAGVPPEGAWIPAVHEYERTVLSKRH